MQLITLASSLLLASSVLAAPGTARRQARNLQRRAGRHGNPMLKATEQGELLGEVVTNKTNVQYSGNWAGAVLSSTGFTSVTGTFTVPTPTTAGSGSAWVGIDGDTCGTAILQTGIDWTKSGSKVTYDAWYEWYPDYAYNFPTSGITIAAGNSITVTVTASSKTGGTATIKNNTTGKSVSHTFSNEASLGSLCEYDAEWIVEDFDSGGSQVSFANFGSVTFTGASAKKGSSTVGVTGATIIDIKQGSTVLTDVSLSGSSGVVIKYV